MSASSPPSPLRRPVVAALSVLVLALGCVRSAPPAGSGAAASSPGAALLAEVAPQAAPRLLDGLGGSHHPITTSQPLAQRYFDQALVLTFGFNHEAAVASFAHAARLDPACASCFWGIALALGPNINAPMGPEAGRRAHAAVQEARRLAPGASRHEQALIEALATRYVAEPPEDRGALDRAYADAMRGVHQAFPEDDDTAVLFAESLMDLYPWDYWTADAQPREFTPEILSVLEMVLARRPDHVGANHYYIHAVEEYFPERAVAAADRLGDLAPDAGHLVHMPSHIYWRVGRYDDALEINQRAAAADEQFFAWCRAGAFYRALYYPHNVHFLWAAASAEGRSEIALSSARKLAAQTRDSLAEFDFMQEFVAIPTLTLVRFGRWDAALGEPRPAAEHVYLTGTWHYARGLALLRTGRTQEAGAELAVLRELAADARAERLILGGGTAPAAKLLSIATAHLEGELAATRGDMDAAVVALERAVALQDGLVYMEPPPWYFPTRQALGAVLLQAGRAPEAEAVYRRDLEQYPKSGWSLFGLAESLRVQGRGADADWAARGFRTAWARADVALGASRF
jgi:tetratricopeptide (TPR) repeat protein